MPVWNTNYNNMTLLCHFDGNFTDYSTYARTITPTSVTSDGTAKLGTFSSKPATIGSPRLDVNAQLIPGTADFTFECWIYTGTAGTNRFFISQGTSGGAAAAVEFYITSLNTIRMYAYSGAVSIESGAVSGNTWYHCRVSRSGINWYLTVTTSSGVQTVYSDTSGTGTTYTGNTKFFVAYNDTSNNSSGCFMDELVFWNIALPTTYAPIDTPYIDSIYTDTLIPKNKIAVQKPVRVNQNVTIRSLNI